MGQFRQTVKTVTLSATGGATDVVRVWDAASSVPITKLAITISSGHEVAPAGDLDYDVLYGGGWCGTPFDPDTTHIGGVSQASGTITGSAEIAQYLHTDTDILPANNAAGPNSMRLYGFPIVVELTNDKVVPVTVYVTFISEILGTHY